MSAHMSPSDRLIDLAESVADGAMPDWESATRAATDANALDAIGRLRTVASIGRFFAMLNHTEVTTPAVPTMSPGTTWGALRISEHVGCGRFGDVYRAWDPALDREVALKILHPGEDGVVKTDIVNEGRLMARVRHPNVVTIYGAQRVDETTGLWMEFIKGRTLAAELTDRGPLPVDELTRVGIQLCSALSAVHEAGLVHRDVKAQNVLREDGGRIVLGDFGTGRELEDLPEPSGALAGTPTYLAPELFAGGSASPRTDLYSLGVLLFNLATRAYPVPGGTLRDLRDAHARGLRTSIRSLRPDLPARLARAIDTALDPNPRRRFATAQDMRCALESCVTEVSSRRAQTRWNSAAALALILVAGSAFTWRAGQTKTTPIPFTARDWVLVTAFENRTGETTLDGALDYALERELSGSAFINVVPRTRVEDVLQLMRRPSNTPIDWTVGREVALRDGDIRAVIAGRVEKVGGAYSVSARILNPVDESTTASVHEASVATGDLVSAVGRIAVLLRRTLGEALPRITTSPGELAKVATPSLRALQLYSQARAMTSEGYLFADSRTPRAVEQLLREAVREDPGFVWAHILIAHAIKAQGGRNSEVLQHLERATVAAAPDVDRYVAEAELADFRGDSSTGYVERTRYFEQALASLDAALQLQPDHFWARTCVLNITRKLGRGPDAEPLRRWVDLRPNSLPVLGIATRLAMSTGRWSDASEYAKRGRALDVPIHDRNRGEVSWLLLFPVREAWNRKDPQQALAAIDAVLADPRVHSKQLGVDYALFYFCLALGRSDCVQRAAALAREEVTAQRFLLVDAAQRGDHVAVRHFAAQLSGKSGELVGGSGLLAVEVVSALIDARMLDSVRQILLSIRQSPRDGHGEHLPRIVEGLLAAADGRLKRARELLEPLIDRTNLSAMTIMRVSLQLADIRAAQGDLSEAIALLENASRHGAKSDSCVSGNYVRVRANLAHLYRQTGRDAEAEAIDSDLRKLLAIADGGHVIKVRLEKTRDTNASRASAPAN